MAQTRTIEGLISVEDDSTGAVDQTGFDLHHLFNSGVGAFGATMTESTPSYDSTIWATTPPGSMSKITGMLNRTIAIQAKFPLASPATGKCGLVTFANGYVLHANGFSVNLNAAAYDATEFDAGTCPTSLSYVPGEISGSGSWEGGVSDTTTTGDAGDAGAASFRLTPDTADNTIAGNIVVTNVNVGGAIGGGLNRITQAFDFNGDVTIAGTNPPLPTGAIGIPDVTELVWRVAGSKTFTVNAFWTSLSFQVSQNALIGVSGTLQCTGDMTKA